jgi:phage terminase large subunit
VAIGPKLSLLDGIQAARWLLQREGTRIHPRCAEGLEALRSYRYEYDEDAKTFTRKPLHDWSSHTADAFRYAAMVVRFTELMTRKKPEPAEPPLISRPERALPSQHIRRILGPPPRKDGHG